MLRKLLPSAPHLLLAIVAATTGCGGDSGNDRISDVTDAGAPVDTDAGAPVDTSGGFDLEGCGDVPFSGECNGNELAFCLDDQLIRIPCDQVRADGICFEVSREYGFDCGVAVGGECVEQRLIDGRPENVAQLCGGVEGGCVVGTGAATCQENVGSCSEPFTEPFCSDDRLVVDCQAGQPTAFDCTAVGGRCAGTGACVEIDAGGPCDDLLLQCDAGLSCVIEDGGVVGSCI